MSKRPLIEPMSLDNRVFWTNKLPFGSKKEMVTSLFAEILGFSMPLRSIKMAFQKMVCPGL